MHKINFLCTSKHTDKCSHSHAIHLHSVF